MSGAHIGAIHVRQKDGVKRSGKTFGEGHWALFREALGMFPPTYDGPLRDLTPDSPEFRRLNELSRDLKPIVKQKVKKGVAEKGNEFTE